jgi:hypothetical protein
MKAIIKQIVEEAYHFGTSRIVLGRLREIENNPHKSKANTLEAGFFTAEAVENVKIPKHFYAFLRKLYLVMNVRVY